MIDFEKVRRETVRWYIILALYNAKPAELWEENILQIIQCLYPDATQLEIRRALDYLSDRELVQVNKQPSGRWNGDLTRHGVDIAEYTVDVDPGIARPEKYA